MSLILTQMILTLCGRTACPQIDGQIVLWSDTTHLPVFVRHFKWVTFVCVETCAWYRWTAFFGNLTIEGAVFWRLQSLHVGHEAGGWRFCPRTSQRVIKKKNNSKLSVETDKSSEEEFDVTHQTTQHTALLCVSPVNTSSKSPLSMTQCMAVVTENVLCITQQGAGMGKIDGMGYQHNIQ